MNTFFLAGFGSFLLTLMLIPIVRWWALGQGLYDLPDQKLKTHATPTPRLGGVAMFVAISIVLLITRLLTDYPTGTIRHFRYILTGAAIVFTLGVIDDIKRGGLDYRWKFVYQFLAAGILLAAPVSIKFLSPAYIAGALSVLWVVGITNSLNLVDIQDGLAGTQAAIACAAFLAISFPSEDIYVNILAAALLGSILGFLPFNFSSKRKVFMGDAGSLTLGYFLAVLALGCSYTSKNPYAVFAPILILGVPLFETFFLIYIRMSRGLSPFRGSRDHTAHRLKNLRFSETNVLATMASATLLLSFLAFMLTRIENPVTVMIIYVLLGISLLGIAKFLRNAAIEDKK